jgi:hypothetical protein
MLGHFQYRQRKVKILASSTPLLLLGINKLPSSEKIVEVT